MKKNSSFFFKVLKRCQLILFLKLHYLYDLPFTLFSISVTFLLSINVYLGYIYMYLGK